MATVRPLGRPRKCDCDPIANPWNFGYTPANDVRAPRGATKGAEVSELHRITVDPQQCGGRPCIRGLRVRVKDVLDLLAAGASHDEILADYPLLEAGDIAAVLEFAARQSDHPILHVA